MNQLMGIGNESRLHSNSNPFLRVSEHISGGYQNESAVPNHAINGGGSQLQFDSIGDVVEKKLDPPLVRVVSEIALHSIMKVM